MMMNKTTRKTAVLALAAISALPWMALADGPTSRPVRPSGGDHTERRNGPYRQQANTRGPISSEQWEEILGFMREHSAHRTEDLENLISAADDKKANFLKQLVAAQYDYVMSLKNEDSQLYDLQVSKIEAQDAIYGMLRDSGKRGMNKEDKAKFRDEVGKLVDVNLSERARRIEKAKDSLAKAQTTLDYDQSHKDAMVDDRMDQFLKEGARPLKLDAPPQAPANPPRPDDAGAAGENARHDAFVSADQQLGAELLPLLVK